jgi:hypothetical protein
LGGVGDVWGGAGLLLGCVLGCSLAHHVGTVRTLASGSDMRTLASPYIHFYK